MSLQPMPPPSSMLSSTADITLPRLQAGGSLRESALYIERPADRELYSALREGKICYILAPRQMGKSSLCSRTARRLRDLGMHCIHLDCLMLGGQESAPDPERWYYSLFKELSAKLDMHPGRLEAFWQRHLRETPAYRWALFLREEILAYTGSKVVLLFDEIDSILSLRFVADGFLAGVRDAVNARAEDKEYQRLSFGFIGVASAGDLLTGVKNTPFNVGYSVRLEDFSAEQAQKFVPILAQVSVQPIQLLDSVLAWTSGHPYMTHKICEELARNVLPSPERVEAVVRELFLDGEDATLKSVEKRFRARPQSDDRSTEQRVAAHLRLYRRLLEGYPVRADREDPIQNELRLFGLCRWEGERLVVRNRIYATVFNRQWLQANEVKRHLDGYLDQWIQSGKRHEYLLSGGKLREAQSWAKGRADLLPEENQFLQASLEAARHAQELLAKKVLWFAAACIVGIVSIGTISHYREANRALKAELQQQREAEHHRKELAEKEGEKRQSEERELASKYAEMESRLRAAEAEAETQRARSVTTHLIDAVSKTGSPMAMAARPSGYISGLYQSMVQLQKMDIAGIPPTASMLDELVAVSSNPVYSTRLLYDGEVLTVAVSPKRDRIASACKAGKSGAQISILDARTYKVLMHLQGGKSAGRALAFSPDGKFLASGHEDGTVHLWSANTGKELRVYAAHRGIVNAVAFAPNSLILASGGNDYVARLWHVETPNPLHVYAKHSAAVAAVAFSPDGERLATAGSEGTAYVWSVARQQIVRTLGGHGLGLTSISFDAKGRILTSSYDGAVNIWRPFDTHPIALPAAGSRPTDADFAPSGRGVLVTDTDGLARVWAASSNGPPLVLAGHTSAINSGAFLNAEQVVTASADHTVRVWDTVQGRIVKDLPINDGELRGLAFSPVGDILITAAKKATRIWDMHTTQPMKLEGMSGSALTLAVSPKGKFVAAADDHHMVQVWDIHTGQKLKEYHGRDTDIAQMAFSPNERFLLAADGKSSLLNWDLDSDYASEVQGQGSDLIALAYSPDGSRLVTGSTDHTAQVWSIHPMFQPSGKTTNQLKSLATYAAHDDAVSKVAFAPGSWFIVTGSDDGRGRIINRNGSPLCSLVYHKQPITAVGYSQNGRLIVTASEDGSAVLWRADNGNRILEMRLGGSVAATSASFSSDSTKVAVGFSDGRVRIYPAQPEQYREFGCKVLREYPDRYPAISKTCFKTLASAEPTRPPVP